MWIWIVVSILTVVLAVFITVYIINYNKFQIAIIKISQAEENIGILLKEKLNLMIRINKFIEDKKVENKLVGIDKIPNMELNNFELNSELDKFNKKIIEITDYSKEVDFDDNELDVITTLMKINIDCLAAQRYYNDNVVIYNELVKCFPSNFVSKFCKYKIKDFYSNEKEEIFEILKK